MGQRTRPRLEHQDSGIVLGEEEVENESDSDSSVIGAIEEESEDVLTELIGPVKQSTFSDLPVPSSEAMAFEEEEYKHENWINTLPMDKMKPIQRCRRYPLKQGTEQLKKYKRIDPLRNASVFSADSESEEEKDETRVKNITKEENRTNINIEHRKVETEK